MLFRLRALNDADNAQLPLIDDYLDQIDQECEASTGKTRDIRLIARSPSSSVAKSIRKRLKELHDKKVMVAVVFTDSTNKKEQVQFLEEYAEIFGPDKLVANIRVANFPAAIKMTEQLQVGVQGAWTEGETSEIYENDESRMDEIEIRNFAISTARVSFAMVWAISDAVGVSR